MVCPDTITLQNALKVSCNTAFARYGTEQLGAEKLKKVAQAFGFETAPVLAGDPNNDYHVAASATGNIANSNGQTDPAALAQSCIGQREVRMTPLQGALIAAAIANNGTRCGRTCRQSARPGPEAGPGGRSRRCCARRSATGSRPSCAR